MSDTQMPRRDFIKSSAVVATSLTVPQALTAGCAEEKNWPEGKLNIAIIGLGKEYGNMKNVQMKIILPYAIWIKEEWTKDWELTI